MNHNKIVTYSLLAHINNDGNLVRDLFEVFKPLVKRTLMGMCNEGITKGKSVIEIKTYVDNQYKLDIPVPVLKIILKRISDEINENEKNKFELYKDGAFALNDYVFVEFEELVKEKENDIKKLEELFKDFCKINNVKLKDHHGIFEFIESNKVTISKYLTLRGERKKEDFTIEALFIDYFKGFKEVYGLIKNIYLGSIISSYIEYQTKPIDINIELLFDTNFIVSLIDLKTKESTHTCNKLVEIAKSLGYKLYVLDMTIQETQYLLEKRAENFDKAFLAKKIDPEDIYNACDRRKLSKTDLQRISSNLEETLLKLGIYKIHNSEKFQNTARFSEEYKKFKSMRNSDFAALHDATVIHYVRERRNNKKIKDFDKVNCWFVNNSSAWHSSEGLISTNKENRFQPESIRAEDFINILWLTNPNIKKQLGDQDIAEIGITRLISCTLNETLPKSTIIRELDDNIQKYTSEKITDKDLIRVATRIANRDLKNLEELNKIAESDSAEFVKRLQKEANIEKEANEKKTKEFQELIDRLVKTERKMDDAKGIYKIKTEQAKAIQKDAEDRVRESLKIQEEEKSKRIEAENKLRNLHRNEFIKKKLSKWRRPYWVALLFLFLVGLYPILAFKGSISTLELFVAVYGLESWYFLSKWVIAFLIGINATILVYKYHNHSSIDAYMRKIEIPAEMQELEE